MAYRNRRAMKFRRARDSRAIRCDMDSTGLGKESVHFEGSFYVVSSCIMLVRGLYVCGASNRDFRALSFRDEKYFAKALSSRLASRF